MRIARAALLLAALIVPVAAQTQNTVPASQPDAPAVVKIDVLKIEGAIPTPLSLTAADLARLPRNTATLTAADGKSTTYEGVLLYDLLAKAGWQFGHGMTGKGMASYVIVTARDGYQVLFTLAELDPMFAGEKILLADKADGSPLPTHDQPFRIVVPGDKMHARSIYSVVKLEVVRLRQ